MAPLNAALKIRIERKAYPAAGRRGPVQVLKDIALSVAPGSFVAITGPSGCGKTTLLNIVAGLDRDFEGSVVFAASEPHLAYVFQTPRLLPWRTVSENVALALPPGDPRLARVQELLVRVGLGEVASAHPERLSLGMRRRAALARAFILDPDFLLMDEPFVSLDEAAAQDLRALLRKLCSGRPVTVLFVTHNTMEAVALATRVVRLSAAPASIVKDVAVALPEELRTSPDAMAAEHRRIFGNTAWADGPQGPSGDGS
jgi:ABC-type nitrate/sulfonate/bicarbonate transport system ATPase subunit